MTSLLVLVSVVVLPLLSLLVDLMLLDTQRTLRRITAIARQDQDSTSTDSITAAQGDLTRRWPNPKEPTATTGSPPNTPLLTLAPR